MSDTWGSSDLKIAVVAVQGGVEEHESILKAAGERVGEDVDVVWARYPEDLEDVDAVVIPGGESTTIGRLMERHDLVKPLLELSESDTPILGTCSGMVLLAREVVPQAHPGAEVEIEQPLLGLMDVRVIRNAFGRQRESFEADVEIEGFEDRFRAVFIRAPAVDEVLSDDVKVLAEYGDHIVAVEQDHLLATAFHPELTDDPRLHAYFLEKV
ncbi:pyridoxal 5'-phosphate synthase glutaminase subunit PdxT [Methanopyrus sp. KOL6]|uniref:pyridoxal 5'-phosphate synthase glutaminase subunit PdxT n=1 Tax=Methanopyrus sp. KOL6 TaxID=1937004 RepID=UPI0031B9D253